MMKKIRDYVMDNYKLMIPIGFMIVLFVAFLVYYKASVSSTYRTTKKEEVYQYFYGRRYDYEANVSRNRKDVIVDVEPIDIKIYLDSTPIYLKGGKSVILPKDMSVVMPTISCAEYLAKGYSFIQYQKGLYMLTTDRYHNSLNHYFFYDGSDLYFFIENVTLYVNNEKITLSPYSYVIAKYNDSVTYYDAKDDIYKTLTIDNHEVIIENDYYKILIDRDIIDYQGNNVILTSAIDKLNTIDKKGR